MQRGTTAMDRELPVKLTDVEIITRAESMAQKLIHIGGLRKKRREDLRSINALIESELDEVQRLARTIADAEEMRKQGDLFVDQVTGASAQEAKEVLADVAAEAQKQSEPRYHGNGALCRKDPCRRRHMTLDQCHANGVKVEGEPLEGGELQPAPTEGDSEADELDNAGDDGEEDPRPRCAGCGNVLTAIEVVKKLGLCEACQVQPHEEINLKPQESDQPASEVQA